MGYTFDTHMTQFIPPMAVGLSAGTWTLSIAANVVKAARTANASAFTALVPVRIPANASPLKGCRVQSVDVYYKILTADATGFAVTLEKMTLPLNTAAPSGASVSGITFDTNHNTESKRGAQAEHKMTVTVDSPAWLDDDDACYLALVVTCAASTVFTLYGARINYDLRL
jgi:hypothetical protein